MTDRDGSHDKWQKRLAIGGAKSYGDKFGAELGYAAEHVEGVSIAGSGHWLMEEQPKATMAAILAFLRRP
ncbi:MAG: hypothetical protein ABI655_05060 [Phenylobacterium sp.]